MERVIVMLGTGAWTRRPGGIRAVIDTYGGAGLFERWPIRFLGTHAYGSGAYKGWLAAGALLRFAALLAGRRVALVHAHVSRGASFFRKSAFILLAAWAGRPVIAHVHSGAFLDFYARGGALRRRYMRYVLGRAAVLVALTPRWAAGLQRLAPAVRVVAIGNPVAMGEGGGWEHATREPHTLLYLGRLETAKGLGELIEAHALVRRRLPDAQLLLAGAGEQGPWQALARRHGVEASVHFLGWVGGEAKAALLRRAGAFVLPSHSEGLPVSVLEAMAWGLPVVASAVGGIPEAVGDGREGLLVPPKRSDLLAQAIERLLADGALQRRMGAAAHARARDAYSTAAVLPQIEALYRRYAGDGPPAEREAAPTH